MSLKSFAFNQCHDRMRAFSGLTAHVRSTASQNLGADGLAKPNVHALPALCSLRQMGATWAGQALVSPDMETVAHALDVVNAHMFETSVYLPRAKNGPEHSRACLVW